MLNRSFQRSTALINPSTVISVKLYVESPTFGSFSATPERFKTLVYNVDC